jgi:hypothetical protein
MLSVNLFFQIAISVIMEIRKEIILQTRILIQKVGVLESTASLGSEIGSSVVVVFFWHSVNNRSGNSVTIGIKVKPRSNKEISAVEKTRSVKLTVNGERLKMSSENAVTYGLLKKRKDG